MTIGEEANQLDLIKWTWAAEFSAEQLREVRRYCQWRAEHDDCRLTESRWESTQLRLLTMIEYHHIEAKRPGTMAKSVAVYRRNGWFGYEKDAARGTHVRRSIPRDLRAQVWAKTDGNCYYCGTPTNPFRNFEVDHYIPVSRGGTGELSNLVPCCSRCNGKKGDRDAETIRHGQRPFYGEMHGEDDNDE